MGLELAGANLAFKGGLFNGNRYLAAMRSASAEITGTSYARILVALADWEIRRGGGNAALKEYVNSAVEDFPTPGAAWPQIWGYGLYDASTAGNRLLKFGYPALTSAPGTGAAVGFDANAIGWGFSGKVTVAGSHKCLTEGLLSGTRYLTLHSGNPGTTGANRQDQPLLVRAADFDLSTQGSTTRRARNNKILSFGVAVTDLPSLVWIALRDGNQDSSAVLWADDLTTPRDPDPGDTLSVPLNGMIIPATIDAA